jgi:hypothetical protein
MGEEMITCCGYTKGQCTYCFRRDTTVYVFKWSWENKWTDESGDEEDYVCGDCLKGFFDNETDPVVSPPWSHEEIARAVSNVYGKGKS